jgi:Pyruvate/2-oxoacid:ferredoxin oxidoreductase gamma subunit
MAASMVMIGAYAAVTEVVQLDALVDAVVASLPPYRARHAGLNQDALRAGHDAAPEVRVPAWESVAAS